MKLLTSCFYRWLWMFPMCWRSKRTRLGISGSEGQGSIPEDDNEHFCIKLCFEKHSLDVRLFSESLFPVHLAK